MRQRLRAVRAGSRLFARLGVLPVVFIAGLASVHAQTLNDRLSRNVRSDARLFVEIAPGGTTVYDRKRDVITLSGDVKLYYDGRTLEADKIIYDRKTKRVSAEGNTRLTEVDGTRYFGDRFELTSDFKDGFVDHFRAVTSDNQRISAARAERTDGDQTVFENGIYTPCLPCALDPSKPPVWQVKADRIIAKNADRTLYFENARLEFWGVPVFGTPYFSMPDPSVTRKSGFLTPGVINKTSLGFGLSTPYFFNLAPNYDLTFTPTFLTKQGVLVEAEWRHRIEAGSYSVAVAGIQQLNPDVFLPDPLGPGNREFRGSVRTKGNFRINDKWSWGWAASTSTDRFFYKNYEVPTTGLNATTYLSDSTSTLYLTGQGERSWFDLRGYYFQALTAGESQNQVPVVLPVFEYDRKFETPLGGELGVSANLVSLRRADADVEALALTSNGTASTGCLTSIAGVCSIVRGISGTYTRIDSTVSWRKAIIDPIGQVWTPFASAEVYGTMYSLADDPAFNTQQQQLYGANENEFNLRAMPTIGLDYRYPFFAATSFGSHVIEPIAQIIASPDEMDVGKRPNEDAQSLSFDDTNLFEWNKFSGNDRHEGGVRANLGMQYTWNLPNGGWVNALAGRSFHLTGRNSFSSGDGVNTGLDSGLDKDQSDYVGRVTVQPIAGLTLSARGRFDAGSFEMKRLEAIADASFQRFGLSATYARFEPQQRLGYNQIREGLALTGSVGLTDYWKVFGGAVLDLDIYRAQQEAGLTAFRNRFQIASANLGISYGDECTTFSASWSRANSLTVTGIAQTSDTYMVRLDLKNLGNVGYSFRRGNGSPEPGVVE